MCVGGEKKRYIPKPLNVLTSSAIPGSGARQKRLRQAEAPGA